MVANYMCPQNNVAQFIRCGQPNYRQFYSTDTADVSVINDIVRATDSDLVSGLVFIGSTSSFDTVDHSVMSEFHFRLF
jgi:hypothetical protein